MDDALRAIPEHMKALALGALAHANWHANYMSFQNRCWSELSVIQAAHAAELLIKARIAEEHPLLIFEHLPKGPGATDLLGLAQLVQEGRTFAFSDLPQRLWATTGYRLPAEQTYREFGRLRNTLQHFTLPENVDCSFKTTEFIYKVIDPFINDAWGLYAIDFNEDYDDQIAFAQGLIEREVDFLISDDLIESWKQQERASRPTEEAGWCELDRRILKARNT